MTAFDARFAEGLRLFAQAYADAARVVIRAVNHAVRDFGRITTSAANDPANVAGLEARYYVRAGLDPRYSTPEELGVLLAQIRAGGLPGLAFRTARNRRLVAVAALRGYIIHRLPERG